MIYYGQEDEVTFFIRLDDVYISVGNDSFRKTYQIPFDYKI